MDKPLFDQIAIYGVGLLGGSLGLAVKEHKLCRKIVGLGRSQPTLDEALHAGAVDTVTTRAKSAISQADLVILCTPVRHIISVLPEVMAMAKPGAVVTDVGSTKTRIVATGEAAQSRAFFVGSHPMAGSDLSGVRYARPDLYADTNCFITKTPKTDMGAFARMVAFWRALETRPVITRPERHDHLVGLVSHLPHLMAVALVRAIAAYDEDKNLINGIVGNGFRDTTRIAQSSAEMWRDICAENLPEISTARDVLERTIGEMVKASGSDGETLRKLLEQASEYREFFDER